MRRRSFSVVPSVRLPLDPDEVDRALADPANRFDFGDIADMIVRPASTRLKLARRPTPAARIV